MDTEKSSQSSSQVEVLVELCGTELPLQLPEDEKSSLSRSGIDIFQLYERIKINSEVYTSRCYDVNKKRANSFVQFCRKPDFYEYGEILYFVRDLKTKHCFCLISLFTIKHVDLFFLNDSLYQLRHLLPVEDSGNLITVSVHCLITKVIKAGKYLCLRPNSYEVNL